jgi:hypothetical protein
MAVKQPNGSGKEPEGGADTGSKGKRKRDPLAYVTLITVLIAAGGVLFNNGKLNGVINEDLKMLANSDARLEKNDDKLDMHIGQINTLIYTLHAPAGNHKGYIKLPATPQDSYMLTNNGNKALPKELREKLDQILSENKNASFGTLLTIASEKISVDNLVMFAAQQQIPFEMMYIITGAYLSQKRTS